MFDPRVDQNGEHVLLAEDHPVNQRIGTMMLQHLGFQVDVVADGSEAVKAASLSEYHAIFMDCRIPVLDGFEATVAIRNLEGTARHTPIIAVTACDAATDHDRCLAAGMDGYLRKPLNLKTLGAALARWAPYSAFTAATVSPAADSLELAVVAAGAALVTDPTRPILDATVVARLARLGSAVGENLVGRLAVLFLADANAQVAALRVAVADHDAQAVKRCAHSLSGASSNLGATHLAHLFSTIATDGAAGDLSRVLRLLDEAQAELPRVHTALRSRA